MQKIASPVELQAALRDLVAFIHGHGPDGKPDRQVIASKLRELADRVANVADEDLTRRVGEALKRVGLWVAEHKSPRDEGRETIVFLEGDNLDSLEGDDYEDAKDDLVQKAERALRSFGRIEMFYQGRGRWDLHLSKS